MPTTDARRMGVTTQEWVPAPRRHMQVKCSGTAIASSFAAEGVLGQINQLDQTHAVEQEQLGIDHRHSWFQA